MRMRWNQRYVLKSYLGSSLWIVPLFAIPLALMAARQLDRLGGWLGWSLLSFETAGAKTLLETIVSPKPYMKRLAMRSGGKTVFVDVEELDWIEAAENYVQLHCGKAGQLLHVPMNTLEKSLDPEIFLRIHRSIIVNIRRIKELQPGVHGEYVITLASGIRLRSGRTYHEKLKGLTNNPF